MVLSPQADMLTIQYNKNGRLNWLQTFNGPGNFDDFATALAIDKNDNVYVTGGSTGVVGDIDYATIKYASNGELQWTQRYNNSSANRTDIANAIAIDNEGNVYITGLSEDSFSTDIATVKYTFGFEVESIVPIASNNPAVINFTKSNDYKSYLKHFGVLDFNNVRLLTYKNMDIKTLLIVTDSTDSTKRVVYSNFNFKNNANKFFTIVNDILGDRTSLTSFTGQIQFLTPKAHLAVDVQLNNGIVTSVFKEKKGNDKNPPFGECLAKSLDALFEFSSGDGSGIICAIVPLTCLAAAIVHCTIELF